MLEHATIVNKLGKMTTISEQIDTSKLSVSVLSGLLI